MIESRPVSCNTLLRHCQVYSWIELSFYHLSQIVLDSKKLCTKINLQDTWIGLYDLLTTCDISNITASFSITPTVFFVNASSRFVFSRQMSQVLCVYKLSLFTFNNTSSSVLVCYFISHPLKSNLKDMCCKNYWWVVIPISNQKKACYDWLTNYILYNVKIYTNNTEIGLCQWYQLTK